MKVARIATDQSENRIRDTAAQDVPLSQAERGWRRGRFLFIVLLALVVLATALIVALQQWGSAGTAVARDRLRIATVRSGAFERDVAVRGTIIAANSPTLFAPADGNVTLHLAAGDRVAAGTVVATVASPGLQNALQQEQASLEGVQIELERRAIEKKKTELLNQQTIDMSRVEIDAAERELRRAEASREQQVISVQDYEKAMDDLAKARLSFQHAQQNAMLESESLAFEIRTMALQRDRQRLAVENLERQVADLQVRSPVDGIVGTLFVDQKAAVALNAALLTIVDLGAFEVQMQVPESYADDLSLGMEGEISFGGATWPATITAISPEVIEKQVSGRLRFSGAVPTGLRQNQQVSARILLESRPQALTVQRGPFIDSGGGRIAYVVEGDLARRRTIRTGSSSVGSVEILDGLNAGEQIVISDLAVFAGAETVLLID